MSIDRLSLSAINQAAALGTAGSGSLVGAAAKAIAVDVLGRLGSQYLAPGHVGSSEPYPLAQWAEGLGGQLGATPLETLELEGALGALAGALASDMAALADGRTLDRLDDALAAASQPGPPDSASSLARSFENLAAHIAQAH
ncbi:hypothetical protein ABVV53_10135 [Novosphingobium sp. RD2P27]|uniref:DUF937 domain-containing protein n=1 Tax=Novosphingobium kalidii TaxID=3230299 RepID=A0ABV2D1Q3_9SPHN